MGTQAVVSLVVAGKVRLKAICGVNGRAAHELASWLASHQDATASMLFQQARALRFGGDDDLVVMDHETVISECDDDLSALYRDTFDDACFNPRWACGMADHHLVVSFDDPGFPAGVAQVIDVRAYRPAEDGISGEDGHACSDIFEKVVVESNGQASGALSA